MMIYDITNIFSIWSDRKSRIYNILTAASVPYYAVLRNYDRPAETERNNHPTNKPSGQLTNMRVHREITLSTGATDMYGNKLLWSFDNIIF